MGQAPHRPERRPEYEYLNRIIPQFCKSFEDGRDCLGDIHREHNHGVWERHLLAGKRFLPDKSSEPYGIVGIPDSIPVSSFVRGYDKKISASRSVSIERAVPGESPTPGPPVSTASGTRLCPKSLRSRSKRTCPNRAPMSGSAR